MLSRTPSADETRLQPEQPGNSVTSDGTALVGQNIHNAPIISEVRGNRSVIRVSSDNQNAFLIALSEDGKSAQSTYSLRNYLSRLTNLGEYGKALWERAINPAVQEPERLDCLKVLVDKLGAHHQEIRKIEPGEIANIRIRPGVPPIAGFLSGVNESVIEVLGGTLETPIARLLLKVESSRIQSITFEDVRGKVELTSSPFGSGNDKRFLNNAIVALYPSPAHTPVDVGKFAELFRSRISGQGEEKVLQPAFIEKEVEFQVSEPPSWNARGNSLVQSTKEISCRLYPRDDQTLLEFRGKHGQLFLTVGTPEGNKAQVATIMHQLMGILQFGGTESNHDVAIKCRELFTIEGVRCSYPTEPVGDELYLALYDTLPWELHPHVYPGRLEGHEGLGNLPLRDEDALTDALCGGDAAYFVAQGRNCDEFICVQFVRSVEGSFKINAYTGLGDKLSWDTTGVEDKDKIFASIKDFIIALSDGDRIDNIIPVSFNPSCFWKTNQNCQEALPHLGRLVSMWEAACESCEVMSLDAPPVVDPKDVRELPGGRIAYFVKPRALDDGFPSDARTVFKIGPGGIERVDYSEGRRARWSGNFRWQTMWRRSVDSDHNPLLRVGHLTVLLREILKVVEAMKPTHHRPELDPDSLGTFGRIIAALREFSLQSFVGLFSRSRKSHANEESD